MVLQNLMNSSIYVKYSWIMNTALLRGESPCRKWPGFYMISVIPFVTYMQAIFILAKNCQILWLISTHFSVTLKNEILHGGSNQYTFLKRLFLKIDQHQTTLRCEKVLLKNGVSGFYSFEFSITRKPR